MARAGLVLGLLAASVAFLPPSAASEPVACQRAIVRENADYLDAVSRALQSCEDKKASGRLPLETDCRTENKTATAIQNAGGALRTGIARWCGGENRVCNAADVGRDADDPLGAIGWDLGLCPGLADASCRNVLADCDDLGVCLACTGKTLAAQAIQLYYGRLDSGAFGSGSPVNKCQRAIGKQAAKYLQARTKILRVCWDARLKGSHAEPCPDPGDGKARALLAKAEATKVRNICKTCGGGDKVCGSADDLTAAAVGFLSRCPAVTVPGGTACAAEVGDLTDLVTCVDCATDFSGACVDFLAIPQFASYPPECGGRLNEAPVADAGPDQDVGVGVVVALDGSGSSDPEGAPLSYEWALVTKPVGSSATLSDPSVVMPTFVADQEGTYVCELVVRDDFLLSAPDSVTIRSRPPKPPVANAGPDQTVAVGQIVQLDGTASSDPDGDSLTFQWTIVTAPPGSMAVLDDPFGPTPTFVADLAGEYTIALVVDDGTAASAPDVVVVSTSNVPPVADAGPDVAAAVGEQVELDGSGSSDADGDALTFLWSLVSMPPGSTATLSDPTAVMPTLTVDVAGTYVVQLVVNDGTADSMPDTVVITTGNTPPVADAGADQAAAVGQTMALDGSGSTDADGDPLTYRWSLVTGPAGTTATLSDPTAVTPEFVVDVAGTYVFQLVVNDGQADSAPGTVRVSTEGLAPVADAGPAQTVTVGTTVTLDGSDSSDPDGDPLTFAWALVTKPVGSVATLTDPAAVTPIFVVDVPGDYVAQLVVSDGTRLSAPDTVTVSTRDSRPIAYAGSDQVVPPGSTVTLDGRQSRDPDGQPLTYQWSMLVRPSGSAATLLNSTGPQPRFVADRPGAYLVQLIVDDGTQQSLPDTVLITTSTKFITLTLQVATLPTFATGTGTVELSEPAEAGGVRVFLASNDPGLADVPTSVTVPEGETTADFEITSFARAGAARITAFTRGWVDDEATLTAVARETTLTLSSPLVGVGLTISGTLSLALPAPSGGATFTLETNNANVATIAPTTVTIPAGATQAQVTVSGIATGPAQFTATATGYVTSRASVTVTQDLVNLPSGVVVAPGQTLPFPVSVTTPAPAGGVTVTLTNSAPGTLAIAPSSVFIAAGETSPATQPQVTGAALGTAAITGSAPGYAPNTKDVQVKLGLTITPVPITVLTYNTTTVTLSLSAQAPSGGATINLSTDDPAIATVPALLVIPAGQAVGSVQLRGEAVGSTTLRASGAGIDEVTAPVTVNPAPGITLSAATVGKNLQVGTGGTLGAPAPAGNVVVTITSGDPTRVLMSPNSTTPGSPSIVLQVGAGSSTIPTFYVHGLGDAGTAEIEATATGYARGTATVTLTPSGFRFVTGSFTTTPASPGTPVTVQVEQLTPGTLTRQGAGILRPGYGVSVPVTNSDPAVGTIASALPFNGPATSVTTSFDPQAAGTAVLSITQPLGFSTPAAETEITATVQAPGITLTSQTVGKDLQQSTGGTLGAPAPAGNLNVTITSSDPAKAVLATTGTATGARSITVQVPAGSTSIPAFYVQALAGTGTVDISASAPGYANGAATVTLVPSGFVVGSGTSPLYSAFATTTLSAPTGLAVWLVRLDPTTLNASPFSGQGRQPLRAGAASVSVGVVSDTPAVGGVTVSPVEFGPNEEVKTTAFDPVGAGTAEVRVVPPAGRFTTPSNLQTVTATVTAPQLSLSNLTVGKDLQAQWAVSLGAPAPAGNVDVTITSGDATRLVLSQSPTVVGSGSLTLPVTAGGSSTATFYAQALEGGGTVTVTATAAGYTTTAATVTLVPSGFVVGSGTSPLYSAFGTTTLSAPTGLAVWSVPLDPTTLNASAFAGARQPLRAGAASVSVGVVSDTPAVGGVTVSPVEFGPSEGVKTTAFDPVGAGTAVVRLQPPAGRFTTPSNLQTVTATVTAPDLILSPITLGKDLQAQWAVSLGAPAPAGNVDVTITSGDATRLVLSQSPTVVGSGSLTLPVTAGGSSTGTFYAQALGGGGTSTVTVTATAPGYTTTAATVTLVPSGFVVGSGTSPLYSAFGTTTLSAPTGLAVWSVPLDPTTLNASAFAGARQPLRAGAAPVSVGVVSDTPAVGGVTVSPVEFGPNEAVKTTAFDPVGAGTAVVRLQPPEGFTIPSNLQTVTATVTAPQLSLGNLTVGKDLQAQWAVSLGAPAPAGNVDVTISSGDATRLVLSQSPTVVGSGSLTLPVTAGGSSTGTFYAQALGGSGTVTVTATAAGYTTTTATVTLVPSGFVIDNLTTSPINVPLSGADQDLRIKPARLDPTTLNFAAVQTLRAGMANTQVSITSDDPAIGEITLSPVTFDGVDNPNERVTSFSPRALGMTTIRVSSPGFSSASNRNNIRVEVVP